MEERILAQVNGAIDKAITDELVGYNKPLNKIVNKVMEKHTDTLFIMIDKNISEIMEHKSFKDEIKKALNDKLAKVLVNRIGGELERKVNELKANPTTRAKITIAIDKIIEGI